MWKILAKIGSFLRRMQPIETLAAMLAVIAVLTSSAYYVFDRPTRERNSIFSAWQIVLSMEGKKGGGARQTAIDQLRQHREDLSGIVLDHAILSGLTLANASIHNASFRYSELSGINFLKARLMNCTLYSAMCDKGNFASCVMDSVNLNHAHLKDCDMRNALFRLCVADSFTSFNGATLSRAEIHNSIFFKSNFDNAILIHSVITSSDICNCRFRHADLSYLGLSGVKASHLDLSLSNCSNLVCRNGTSLDYSCFNGAICTNASFEDVSLVGADFFRTNLRGAKFVRCDLRNANFSSSDLRQVTIESCHLSGAVFLRAKTDSLKVVDSKGYLEDAS
jgi:uncharacterized protein YjbI with pentapeptide repeats